MADTTKTRYTIEEIMLYQNPNNMLPKQLSPFCGTDIVHGVQNLSQYIQTLTNITKSVLDGNNPNDIKMRNSLRFYINFVNHSNYKENIKKMKNMDYSSPENVTFLAEQLIKCGYSHNAAINGLNTDKERANITIPEVCAEIAKEFSSCKIEGNHARDPFRIEIAHVCEKLFNEFIDPSKNMDEHNKYSTDNFKGFMTMLGLLNSAEIVQFGNSVIPNQAIIICLDKLKNTIFARGKDNPKITPRTDVECSNFHKGYEFLVNCIVKSLTSKIPVRNDTFVKKQHTIEIFENAIATEKYDRAMKYVERFMENRINGISEGRTLHNIISNIKRSNVTIDNIKAIADILGDDFIDRVESNGGSNEPTFDCDGQLIGSTLLEDIFNKIKYKSIKHITDVIGSNTFDILLPHILVSEHNIMTVLCAKLSQLSVKTVNYIRHIITIHDEITELNKITLCVNGRKQTVSPISNYSMSTHLSLRANLEQLLVASSVSEETA